ncbi:MAG: 50S ribosomal protein L6 [Bacteroidetes bacterium QS_8_68_15]|nr:MAG: 50S ribosomal protein L6 [Bacteroidetes bacterium QS_8_68_15]
MARMGNTPVPIADEVTVEVASDNTVTVDGPKGQLDLQVDDDLSIEVDDEHVVLQRASEERRERERHGLFRSLLTNVMVGVTDGYTKELEIRGIGYRASVDSDGVLELALGFSHPIFFVPPEGVALSTHTERGNNPVIVVEGIDKQLVGQVAAKIRSLRPPEPYKGKGVRYVGEHVERKAGKTAAR